MRDDKKKGVGGGPFGQGGWLNIFNILPPPPQLKETNTYPLVI